MTDSTWANSTRGIQTFWKKLKSALCAELCTKYNKYTYDCSFGVLSFIITFYGRYEASISYDIDTKEFSFDVEESDIKDIIINVFNEVYKKEWNR